jgi:hypothetical protein
VTTALERMLERTGKTITDFRSNSQLGEIFRRTGVRATPEFQRIKFLPRRSWLQLSEDGYREKLSEFLRAPGGTMTLRPAQVAVLTEAYDYRGCVGQLGLGAGKTLVTALLPTILSAERPVLLAPAKLRDKTARDFQKLREHWLVHPKIEFISYEQLARVKQAELLEQIDPDLIMADEVHRLKNLNAGCTKRVKRRMSKRPDTVFVGLSGTLTVRTPLDYWHLSMWALQRSGLLPLPKNYDETHEWALAIGVKVDDDKRVAPGALLELAPEGLPEIMPAVTKARLGVQKRLRDTPGFVMTADTDVDASLTLQVIRPPRSERIEEALERMRKTRETPNGDTLIRPVDVWRQARELACGFYYRWEPAAHPIWLLWRTNWGRYVRHVLQSSSKLDTPLQVQQWVERTVKEGRKEEPFTLSDPDKPDDPEATIKLVPSEILRRWIEVRPVFKPNPVAYWIDDSYMRWLVATELTPKHPPTVVWVEHIAVATKLRELSGMPFCNRNARDDKGRHIEDLGGQHVIASIESCGEGVNLQESWSRNLVVSCPPVGKVWEQMIGRTHRSGQTEDEVEVLVLGACPEQEQSLEQATLDAEYVFESTGQQQRLLLADRV